MEMEIRRVEMVRQHRIDQHRVRVWRQIVDEANAEHVTGPHVKRRARDASFVCSQVQAIAADILVGISDFPRPRFNCASGATWVSLHHGGGVGIGYSQHAGMVIVADGTPEAARRIARACSGTIPPPASCVTPTLATRTRSPARGSTS
jgi:hypothetical protein